MYIEKWYEKSWVIILFLIFLFPVGVYLMWANKYEWEDKSKYKISLVGAIVFIFVIVIAFNGTDDSGKKTTVATTPVKVETSVKDEALKVYYFKPLSNSGVVGSSVTFSCSTNGSANTEYQVSYQKNSINTIVQPYTKSDKFEWTPTEPGTYSFCLTIKDGSNESKSDITTITIISKEEFDAKAAAEAKTKADKAAADAEAKAKTDAEMAKAYDTGITFENLARNPLDYKSKKVTFTGKIIQVISGTGSSQYRFAVNSDYDQIMYLEVPSTLLVSGNILQDDILTIKGISQGTIDYTSTLGGKITVPAVTVNSFVLIK